MAEILKVTEGGESLFLKQLSEFVLNVAILIIVCVYSIVFLLGLTILVRPEWYESQTERKQDTRYAILNTKYNITNQVSYYVKRRQTKTYHTA